MPDSTSRNTLSRQWELLKCLPGRAPGVTCAQLQAYLQDMGYQVSKRTIERDLQNLSGLFPLQCNDRGTPWGWFWAPGATLELPGMGLGEALSLVLVEKALHFMLPVGLRQGLEPRFRQARRKLESLAEGNATARWLGKVASVQPELSLQAPEIDEVLLETIQRGLLEEQQLHCHYYAAHQDRERELTLNPLALVQRGLITYLIATAQPYTDVRQYAIHRFRQVELLPTPTVGGEQFDLQTYLDSNALQFGPTGKILLQAWISSSLARLIKETPFSSDMTLEPLVEGYRLQATVSDSWQLRWWLLQQGESLCVEAPEDLRAFMRETLRRTLLRYNAPGIGSNHQATTGRECDI
ncbi:helix-turn-helix transcriptional regulator [Azomonas macrocytogenes]|uniref:Putative DNA-binding transcriptional regulator YafY n=1 Tax=Azomonas macrocytogenes TaxID=69962 RepID=A0A839T3I6_AZOMA|nr:WYL domain-containing protein [Azomonas macrocytogenes]MBB3102303.1 putative DNA-binding transcriptional regulator YafY [Azomonas macrocytogenes]